MAINSPELRIIAIDILSRTLLIRAPIMPDTTNEQSSHKSYYWAQNSIQRKPKIDPPLYYKAYESNYKDFFVKFSHTFSTWLARQLRFIYKLGKKIILRSVFDRFRNTSSCQQSTLKPFRSKLTKLTGNIAKVAGTTCVASCRGCQPL